MTIVISVALRLACLALGAFRVLGLGLASAVGTSWQFIPSFAMFYFAISPKPRASSWPHVLLSGTMFVAAAVSIVAELTGFRGEGVKIRMTELIVLMCSLATHLGYALWKNRGLGWGLWERV